jgi:hypothetical protein
MVIRKVKSDGLDGRKVSGYGNLDGKSSAVKPGPGTSTAKIEQGAIVNTRTGGAGTIVTAPPQKPIIEERPYTMKDAVDTAIKNCPEWQAALSAGKITEQQILSIVLRQLG